MGFEPDVNSNMTLRGSLHDMAALPTGKTGWEVNFTQTESGQMQSDIILFKNGPFELVRSIFDKGMIHAGAGPVARRGFIVQLEACPSYQAYGRNFASHEILSTPLSRELDSVSRGGINNVHFSLPVEDVESQGEAWGCTGLLGKLDAGGTFTPSSRSLAGLKQVLRRAVGSIQEGRDLPDYGLVRQDVMDAFAACLVSVGKAPKTFATTSRRQAVRRAIDYIRSCGNAPQSLADISAAAGVSERTLHYAFRQCLGVTPNVYCKRYRLNGVRRELSRLESGSITEVATRWGFWHMGQFGVDYKRLFGELPSMTLRRMPARVQFLVPPHLFSNN